MSDEISDERLSAFLDDALPPQERAALEQALQTDAAARARLEALRQADEAVRAAYAAPDLDTPSPRLAALVRDAAIAPQDRLFAAQRMADRWRVPIAAGIALVVGAAGGLIAAPRGGALDPAAVPAGGALHAMLEQAPSGAERALDGAGVFRASSSFRIGDGRYCREVEVQFGASASAGVACRQDDRWRFEVLTAAATAPSGGYETVGDDAAAVLDAALSRLDAQAPLDAEAEAALIARDWR